MKRWFYVVLEIALLVIVLSSDFVQYFFADLQRDLTNWMVDVSSYTERRELDKFRQRVSPHLQNMSSYQQEYFENITSSRDKLNRFYVLYCKQQDKNPYIYGNTLRYLCSEIRSSESLFH